MHNLKQHVIVPTHTGNKYTLDQVVTRVDEEVLLEYSVRTYLSDHFYVRYQLSIDRPHPAKVEKTYRKTRNVDTDVFRHDLANFALLFSPAENHDVSDLSSQYAETALSFWFQGESIGLVQIVS